MNCITLIRALLAYQVVKESSVEELLCAIKEPATNKAEQHTTQVDEPSSWERGLGWGLLGSVLTYWIYQWVARLGSSFDTIANF